MIIWTNFRRGSWVPNGICKHYEKYCREESSYLLLAQTGRGSHHITSHHIGLLNPENRVKMLSSQSKLEPSLKGSRSPLLSAEPGNKDESSEKRPIVASPSSSSSWSKSLASAQANQSQQWFEQATLLIAILAWYLIGVGAIVTTKILLSEWGIPPMLLTFQQLLVSSTFLRLVTCFIKGGSQPLPWEYNNEKSTWGSIWEHHSDFVLAGVFNALDFLASNSAFSRSAASFVETIKSSDPITTTAVALAWNVDRLRGTEAVALSLLIVGVLLSTWGNSQSKNKNQISHLDTSTDSLHESIMGASIVMVANLCFAFRAMFQKRYRAKAISESQEMDDINLLCRMQQTGAMTFFIPVVVISLQLDSNSLLDTQRDQKIAYLSLSAFNATCYALYKYVSSPIMTSSLHADLNILLFPCRLLQSRIFVHSQ